MRLGFTRCAASNDIYYNVANWNDDQAEFDCIYSYPTQVPPFNTYTAAQILNFVSSSFLSNMLIGDMDPEMFHQPDLHFSITRAWDAVDQHDCISSQRHL